MSKYIVKYSHAATGYGWEREYNRLEDFEDFVDEMRTDALAFVSVYDRDLMKAIFYKGHGFKPQTDLLGDANRDMRTTTSKRKVVSGE